MTRLSEINTYAETTVSQLIASGATREEIEMHFKLMSNKADQLLRQYDFAKKLELLHSINLLNESSLMVVREAVNAILEYSNNLPADIAFINDSGIHAIIDINHLNLVLTSLFQRADELHRGSAIKVWLSTVFRKQGYYTTRYNATIRTELNEEPTIA